MKNKVLFSYILICMLLNNKTICGEYTINENGLFEIYGTCYNEAFSSVSTSSLSVLSTGTLQNGNSGIYSHTGKFYIDGTGDDSEVNGIINNYKDADFLNDGKLYITKKHNYNNDNTFNNLDSGNNAQLNTSGLFINQNEIIVGTSGILKCDPFNRVEEAINTLEEYQLQYKDSHGNYDSEHIEYTNQDWETAFQTYINDIRSNCNKDPNRGGILNGFLNNNNVKYYKFNGKYSDSCGFEENKEYSIVPVATGNAKNGIITFIPGATVSSVSNDVIGEINGGIINLKNYIILLNPTVNENNYTINLERKLNSESLKENYDEPFDATVSNGKNLKALIKNATIELFDTTTELNSGKILKIANDLDGSTDDKTLFLNLTFENCTAEIPDDISSKYKAKSREIPYTNESSISLPDSNSLYKFKRLLNSDIYKLVVDCNNNYPEILKLFNSSIRHKIYHGIYNNNSSTIKKIFDDVGRTIYNYTDNTTSIPTDGLILRNKYTMNKYSFSDLFNKFINYNCYVNLTEDNEENLVYEESIEEKTSNRLNLNLLDNNSDLNNTTLHQKDIYLQLINNKNIQISNKFKYGTNNPLSEKEFSTKLRLILNNPWEYKQNEISGKYTGSIYRVLPTSINENNRITQIYQNYDGPAFNRYKITISSSDNLKTNKNNCTNSEILQYVVVCNSPDFSAKSPSGKEFVCDKFTVGDGSNTIQIQKNVSQNNKVNDILTQHFIIKEKATLYVKGHITVTKIKRSHFNNENSKVV